MELENHELFEECIKERIRRLLVYILFSCKKYDNMLECLEMFEKSCDEKWARYISKKKQAFAIFDEIYLEKLLREKVKNKRIFIYGAGVLAEKNVKQLEKINQSISGIVVSDGQPKENEFMGYSVVQLSDFLKEEKGTYILSIAMADIYACEVIEDLNSHGIYDYIWLYEKIYEK